MFKFLVSSIFKETPIFIFKYRNYDKIKRFGATTKKNEHKKQTKTVTTKYPEKTKNNNLRK